MSERIYIAGALAFCSHALLFGLVNTLASDTQHSAPSILDERTTVTLVDMDFIFPEPATLPTPVTVPTKPPSKPSAISSNSASTLPSLSKRRVDHSPSRPEPGVRLPTRPDSNAPNNPGSDKSQSLPPSQSGLSPRGLGMRGTTPGPIDVRGQGQLAAAIAAAEIPSAHQRGDILRGIAAPELGITPTWSPSGNGTFTATEQPFKAKITRDGRIHFRDKPNIQIEGIKVGPDVPLPMLAGRFDLTDAVMASFGEVLYPYRKLKLMDESRDARAQMAKEYEAEVLKEALLGFRKRLTRIWSNANYRLPERKKILFLLWDECAESGPIHIMQNARAIRATTMRFIRRKIPQSHSNAYSDKELQLLNASRQSKERFAPY